MRRRLFPNMIGNIVELEERQERMERVMQILGITPEYPYTVNINDGTRNRVMLGLVDGDYGIKIVDNAGNEIILANGTIVADAIKTGTLDSDRIAAGSITVSKLNVTTLSSITANAGTITAGTIYASLIKVGTFPDPNDRFVDGTLSGVKISENTLHANRIVAESITSSKIDSRTINADRISVGTLTYYEIKNEGLKNQNFPNNEISGGKIQNLSITSAQIADATITNAKIANLSADKLNAGTISVGFSGRPGSINIRRSGTDGFLTWEGGSKIWCDGDQYMGFRPVGERMYFYVGDSGVYALFQRYTKATFYTGMEVQGGGINVAGDLEFISGEHHVKNIDGLVGANDIRYVLGNDAYYHSFCDSGWNEHAWITSGGSLEIDGNFIAHGSKSFRIEHPENPDKYIQYAAIESPEVAVKIRGRAKLAQGKIRVNLPRHWELVVDENGLTTIQLTAIDDCGGLYAPKDKIKVSSFEVSELNNGNSNAEFCWELTAVRKGFRDYVVEPTKEDIIAEHTKEAVEAENNMNRQIKEKVDRMVSKGVSRLVAEREVALSKPTKRSELEMKKFREYYKKLTGKKWTKKVDNGLRLSLNDGIIITDRFMNDESYQKEFYY
jgi:hypothetical protein